MTNEQYIISQLAFYTELHHHLPKIQPKWFVEKAMGNIVKANNVSILFAQTDSIHNGKHFPTPSILMQGQTRLFR